MTVEALLAGAQLLTFGAESPPPVQRLAEEMHSGRRGFLIENLVGLVLFSAIVGAALGRAT